MENVGSMISSPGHVSPAARARRGQTAQGSGMQCHAKYHGMNTHASQGRMTSPSTLDMTRIAGVWSAKREAALLDKCGEVRRRGAASWRRCGTGMAALWYPNSTPGLERVMGQESTQVRWAVVAADAEVSMVVQGGGDGIRTEVDSEHGGHAEYRFSFVPMLAWSLSPVQEADLWEDHLDPSACAAGVAATHEDTVLGLDQDHGILDQTRKRRSRDDKDHLVRQIRVCTQHQWWCYSRKLSGRVSAMGRGNI
ncbi:hypothetical protein C8J57DRAFT_1607027 [Mycena rebaudengoi]|nr:hypothetical protein C8J57DRAFT_1607027 [Mycena rebaudengoi]